MAHDDEFERTAELAASEERFRLIVTSAQEYKLVFAGLNEAQSGKQAIVTVHRFKPGAAQNISYLGDDYAALDLPGEALSDSLITGAGLSKFYKVQFA